jgi:uncharacterized protein YbaA (DUF1428 family)
MTYVEGFILPVLSERKEEYRQFAERVWGEVFQPGGTRRNVEAWADDVPDGTVTDFRKAVQAEDGEEVVFAWLEYPDRATRDATNERMRSDPGTPPSMPFDGKRMIFGGFVPIVDEGEAGGPSTSLGTGGYVDGFVVPVREDKKDAYGALARKGAPIFREHGATRVVEAWADDVPDGKVTDFRRAVQAEEGEQVVFSFIEWPSKEARDAGWGKVMADERMKPEDGMPFDGKRMFWGGFRPILDVNAG